MKSSLLCVSIILGLVPTFRLHAAPQKITVPAHIEYCVHSTEVSAQLFQAEEVRNALFQKLYTQIAKSALDAGLTSMGVPFVDAVTRGADVLQVSIADTPLAAARPTPTYVVHQCAIVHSRGSPSLPASGLRAVPMRLLYAILCASASIELCKREIETTIRQENPAPADLLRPIVWRTRQALNPEDSMDNLINSMSDAKLLTLKLGTPFTTVPKALVVQTGELGEMAP